MKSLTRSLAGLITCVLMAWAAWHGGLPAADEAVPVADDEVHRAPGATRTGMPVVADPSTSGRLRLQIVTTDPSGSTRPTFARVAVTGSDGNSYEPADNPLAPWSLHRVGNRTGKGPFRYYGWFFYAGPGIHEIDVPAGEVRIEAWKGFEYLPTSTTATLVQGKTTEHTITLTHAAPVADQGWFSGDTHIHLARRTETDDLRCLDLGEAEDIRFAHILCMNEPRTYQPTMEQQIHPQMQGMGRHSIRRRGDYQIASGQEYRANTYGHICLIGGSRLVDADGLKTDPNNWPPFGVVADELHGIGGYAFHAHGGYGKEIYADLARQATDGVELLQFAEYRGIGLEGWYHILNAGYQLPAVGACDYPYCRALGDCRTYCFLGNKSPTFENWNKAVAEGRSFFTTGPLLRVSVNRQANPGDTIELPADGAQSLQIDVSLQSPTCAVDELLLIEGGDVRERVVVRREHRRQACDLKFRINVDRSTWIAIRATGRSSRGREDVEAHTNPIFVKVGETSAVQETSVEWLLSRLDERIAVNSARAFPQKEQMLKYLQDSRQALVGRLANANR